MWVWWIFKTIFKVVATVIGGIACGPPCAAIGSAIATGVTGGSFQEALLSGATAYIGASITQNISASIGDAAIQASATEGLLTGAATGIPGEAGGLIIDVASGAVITQGAIAEAALKQH